MPTSERSLQGSKGMRRGGADTPVTEEPYERIVHVRVCGGAGRATAGPTRNRTAPPPVSGNMVGVEARWGVGAR